MRRLFIEGRIAFNETPIEELIVRYSSKFRKLYEGRPDVRKYYQYEGKRDFRRLVMVSQLNRNSPYYCTGRHNIIITVFGQRQKSTKQTFEGLLKKLNIETKPVPPKMSELWGELTQLAYDIYFS